jgi:hypothetical protein
MKRAIVLLLFYFSLLLKGASFLGISYTKTSCPNIIFINHFHGNLNGAKYIKDHRLKLRLISSSQNIITQQG